MSQWEHHIPAITFDKRMSCQSTSTELFYFDDNFRRICVCEKVLEIKIKEKRNNWLNGFQPYLVLLASPDERPYPESWPTPGQRRNQTGPLRGKRQICRL